MSIPKLWTVYFVHIAVVLCEITSAWNTCKVTSPRRVMFNKIVNINHIISKFAPLVPYKKLYICNYVYKFWQETSYICGCYIKKLNGPKFADPSMADDRPLLKRSMSTAEAVPECFNRSIDRASLPESSTECKFMVSEANGLAVLGPVNNQSSLFDNSIIMPLLSCCRRKLWIWRFHIRDKRKGDLSWTGLTFGQVRPQC